MIGLWPGLRPERCDRCGHLSEKVWTVTDSKFTARLCLNDLSRFLWHWQTYGQKEACEIWAMSIRNRPPDPTTKGE